MSRRLRLPARATTGADETLIRLPSRPSAAIPARPARSCPGRDRPTGAADALRLQRAAGNRAVTVALAGEGVGRPTLQRLPEWMEQIWEVGPLDALDARDASIYAREAAAASGLPGFSDGPQDAYRHAYWSCLMALSIGADQAAGVGDVHEDQATTHPFVTLMDKHNNAIGRLLAAQARKREDVHAAVMGALRRGNLIIIPN